MSETPSSEQFKKTFDAYFAKWWKVVGILMLLVYLLAFGLYTIGILNKHLDIALPSFLRAIVTFEYWSWMNDTVVEAIGIGFISVGALTVGVVSIGACSVGVISIGAFSVGIVAVGAFSIGIFAFGGNSFGVIAIGAGTRHGYEVGPRGRFDIGRAVGVIAIGPEAHGVYTLSYTGRGVYTLSPDHQDADAVALFTRWMPKFKGALSPVS
jgi:hypothetical protein